MPKPFRAFYALHKAHVAIFRSADKTLKSREGILTTHQMILFILCAEDGLPSSEVAARASMSKSRLTGLVDSLVKKGLIRRERGHTDARQTLIFIKPEGRALIDRTKSWVQALNANLLKNFNRQEQETIRKFLEEAARVDDARDSERE